MAETKPTPAPTDPPPSYETAAQPSSNPPPPKNLQQPPAPRAPLPLDLPVLNTLRGKRCILASASPRRKQLLAQIGLTNLEIIPSPLPEDLPKSLSPFEYVLQTAIKKAMHVYAQEIDNTTLGEPTLVLSADTIITLPTGAILEKPTSHTHHISLLHTLRSSGYHRVYTAVVAMTPLSSARDPGYGMESTVEETIVRFSKDVSDELIEAYVKTREGADKAGGYGIQGMGALLVERIEGGWDNVVGLPLRATLGVVEKALALGQADEGEDEEGEE